MEKGNIYKVESIFDIVNLNYSIYNFRSCVKELVKEKQDLGICLVNIINFKSYNYIFGYEYGDILLDMVFSRINRCINAEDSIYRFGGDKLLIAVQMNDKNVLGKTVSRIIEAMNFPFKIKDKKVRVCVNVGISIYPKDSNSIGNALKYADIALNYSREISKTPYEFFKTYMYQNVIKNKKIITNIESALKKNQFILYYQPQIDINTMKVYGAEALIRWNHPDFGVIPPLYFIETIEQNGMIIEIGKFVLYEACNAVKRLHDLGYYNLSMSINISQKQLEDDLFLTFVKDLLVETGIEGKCLIFEMTESILIKTTPQILNILSNLQNIGIKIFIDDFGTKYSSLNYLYKMPLDGIKIDKSFVDKIHNFGKEFIITKNIVRLADELNIEVVAEGIETSEQLKCLANMNCNKIQGFLFEKPVTENDYISFLNVFNKQHLKA